jgi:hypothetical protein
MRFDFVLFSLFQFPEKVSPSDLDFEAAEGFKEVDGYVVSMGSRDKFWLISSATLWTCSGRERV